MGINKNNLIEMKFAILAGLFAADAAPPTHCCASGKAAGAADDTVQERCSPIAADGVEQVMTAITTPAVIAVAAKQENECSPSGVGNNVAGDCLPCAAAGQPAVDGVSKDNQNNDCVPPVAVTAVDAADAVTATWPAHCIESAMKMAGAAATAAYLFTQV